ncbi:MAG: hypothetical protein ACPIOQ_22070, partial [Promethearchaeia archaeon]
RGRKRRWRRRVRTISLVVMVLLFVYFFGRTTYQLSFFIKAAQQRWGNRAANGVAEGEECPPAAQSSHSV